LKFNFWCYKCCNRRKNREESKSQEKYKSESLLEIKKRKSIVEHVYCGDYDTLSHEKMQANKNLCHPRIVENLPNGDKNFTKFPICYPTGSFFSLGYESLKKKILGGDKYEEDDYNQFD